MGRRKQGRKVPAPPPNLTGKVTFEQRLEGAEGGSQAGGTAFPAWGTASVKPPSGEPTRPLEEP